MPHCSYSVDRQHRGLLYNKYHMLRHVKCVKIFFSVLSIINLQINSNDTLPPCILYFITKRILEHAPIPNASKERNCNSKEYRISRLQRFASNCKKIKSQTQYQNFTTVYSGASANGKFMSLKESGTVFININNLNDN